MLKRLTLIAVVVAGLTACGSGRGTGQNEAEAPTPNTSEPSCTNEFYDSPGVSKEGVEIIAPTTDCGTDIIIEDDGQANCIGDFTLLQVGSPTSPVETRRHNHYTEITWGSSSPGAIVVNGEKWSFPSTLDSGLKFTQLWDKHWGGAIDGADIVKVCIAF